MSGGVHGEDEIKVYKALCNVVEEWIELYKQNDAPLFRPTAGKKYSGKFNLRVGKGLHEQLSIDALRKGESLNAYCLKMLQGLLFDRS